MMSGERNRKPIHVFTYGKEMENSCNTHSYNAALHEYVLADLVCQLVHCIIVQCNVHIYTNIICTNINICRHTYIHILHTYYITYTIY